MSDIFMARDEAEAIVIASEVGMLYPSDESRLAHALLLIDAEDEKEDE